MFLGDASQQTILGVVFIEPQTKATVLVDVATKTFYQIVNPTAETPVGTTYSFLTNVTGTVTPPKDANSIAQITVIPNGYNKFVLDTTGFLMQDANGVFISTKDATVYRISNPSITVPVWYWSHVVGNIFFKGIDFNTPFLEMRYFEKQTIQIPGLIIPGVSPTNTFNGDAGSSFLKGDNGLNYQLINPSVNTPVGNHGLVSGYVFLKTGQMDTTKELFFEVGNNGYTEFQPITAVARTGVIVQPPVAVSPVIAPSPVVDAPLPVVAASPVMNTSQPVISPVVTPSGSGSSYSSGILPAIPIQTIMQPTNDMIIPEQNVIIPGQTYNPAPAPVVSTTPDNVVVNIPKTSFKFTPATAALALLGLLFMVRK